MFKFFSINKSQFSTFFLIILLVSLFCSLSLLDAAEYVHCVHPDICEFLELRGHLTASRKAEDVMNAIHRTKNHSLFQINGFVGHLYFFLWFKNMIFSLGAFKNLLWSIPLYILSRYINPYDDRKILSSPLKKGSKIVIPHENIYAPPARYAVPSQTLQIIACCIINS